MASYFWNSADDGGIMGYMVFSFTFNHLISIFLVFLLPFGIRFFSRFCRYNLVSSGTKSGTKLPFFYTSQGADTKNFGYTGRYSTVLTPLIYMVKGEDWRRNDKARGLEAIFGFQQKILAESRFANRAISKLQREIAFPETRKFADSKRQSPKFCPAKHIKIFVIC